MSYENGTEHYNLALTVGTDKRDWFDENSAKEAVDADLYAAKTASDNNSTAIASLTTRVGDAETNISNLQTANSERVAEISALQTATTNLNTEVTDVRRDSEDMITAYNEASATSTHAYSVGDYFIYNDVLYKATDSIAIGDTIVPDTNCTTTNVTTEISEINTALSGMINDASTATDVTWSANKINTELLGKLATSVLTMDGTNLDIAFADNKLKITYKLTSTVWILIQLSGAPATDGYKMAFYSTHDAGSTWDSYWTIPNA